MRLNNYISDMKKPLASQSLKKKKKRENKS